ncbi:MAG: hypothetical protein ACLT3Y_02760 [Ruminococcus callidus]
MMTVAEWKRALNAGKLDEKLKQLYGSDAAVMAKKRYTEALEEFAKLYPERKQVSIFSAPGHSGWAATTQITSTAVSLRRQSIWM